MDCLDKAFFLSVQSGSPAWLKVAVAARTGSVGLLAGCCVDLPVHAVLYINRKNTLGPPHRRGKPTRKRATPTSYRRCAEDPRSDSTTALTIANMPEIWRTGRLTTLVTKLPARSTVSKSPEIM